MYDDNVTKTDEFGTETLYFSSAIQSTLTLINSSSLLSTLSTICFIPDSKHSSMGNVVNTNNEQYLEKDVAAQSLEYLSSLCNPQCVSCVENIVYVYIYMFEYHFCIVCVCVCVCVGPAAGGETVGQQKAEFLSEFCVLGHLHRVSPQTTTVFCVSVCVCLAQ